MIRLAILTAAMLLSGCSAVGTVTNLATAPVRAASKTVDVATVSQSERDEARGREIRRREERLGQLEREHRKASHACEAGDSEACMRRDAARREIQAFSPQVPYEPE